MHFLAIYFRENVQKLKTIFLYSGFWLIFCFIDVVGLMYVTTIFKAHYKFYNQTLHQCLKCSNVNVQSYGHFSNPRCPQGAVSAMLVNNFGTNCKHTCIVMQPPILDQ